MDCYNLERGNIAPFHEEAIIFIFFVQPPRIPQKAIRNPEHIHYPYASLPLWKIIVNVPQIERNNTVPHILFQNNYPDPTSGRGPLLHSSPTQTLAMCGAYPHPRKLWVPNFTTAPHGYWLELFSSRTGERNCQAAATNLVVLGKYIYHCNGSKQQWCPILLVRFHSIRFSNRFLSDSLSKNNRKFRSASSQCSYRPIVVDFLIEENATQPMTVFLSLRFPTLPQNAPHCTQCSFFSEQYPEKNHPILSPSRRLKLQWRSWSLVS